MKKKKNGIIRTYWVTQKLPQIYTANHATFPIRFRKITVQTYGNFWVTQYLTYENTAYERSVGYGKFPDEKSRDMTLAGQLSDLK